MRRRRRRRWPSVACNPVDMTRPPGRVVHAAVIPSPAGPSECLTPLGSGSVQAAAWGASVVASPSASCFALPATFVYTHEFTPPNGPAWLLSASGQIVCLWPPGQGLGGPSTAVPSRPLCLSAPGLGRGFLMSHEIHGPCPWSAPPYGYTQCGHGPSTSASHRLSDALPQGVMPWPWPRDRVLHLPRPRSRPAPCPVPWVHGCEPSAAVAAAAVLKALPPRVKNFLPWPDSRPLRPPSLLFFFPQYLSANESINRRHARHTRHLPARSAFGTFASGQACFRNIWGRSVGRPAVAAAALSGVCRRRSYA
jgi:hypothetical protein